MEMWSVNVSAICLMFLATNFMSSLEIKQRKVPRGTDITLTCPFLKADGSSLSVSAPSNSNIRQFYYDDTLYIVISDFCQHHKGPYLCIKDDKVSLGTVLDLTESSIGGEIVKFRPVGDGLLLLCTGVKTAPYIKWQWSSSDSLNKDTIEVNSDKQATSTGHFYNRLKTSEGTTYAIQISPVSFMDSGQYMCRLPGNTVGITVHLVTVEVKAQPPSLVDDDNVLALTCSVSHLISNTNIVLVWVKINGSNSVPVKSETVTHMLKENTLFMFIKDINEHTTNFTCLVFTENRLVTLLPVKLNYTRNPKSEPSLTGTTTSNLRSNSSSEQWFSAPQATPTALPKTGRLTVKAASLGEDTPSSSGINVLRITVRSVISVMILVPFILSTIQLSRYIGAMNTESATSTSNLKDEHEICVRFEK